MKLTPLYQKAQRFAQGADLDALNAFRANLRRAAQEREAKQRDALRSKAEAIVQCERERVRKLQAQAKQAAEVRELAQKKLAELQAEERQLKDELSSLRGLFTAKRRKEIEGQLKDNLAQQSEQRLRLGTTPSEQPPLPAQDQRSDQELVEEWLAKMLNSDESVRCPMPGTILRICVSEGQPVKKGGALLILEAMKMENEIMAPGDGIVSGIYVAEGQPVETGELLASIVHAPRA